MWLRQSTASQEILLGTFLDSGDGNTAETALVIANTDIKLWKEGGTTEASKNSGGATHIASGRYYAVLDATDTNTLGKLEINVHVAGALAVRREFMVLPANVYDSLVLGTDKLDVTAVDGTVTTLTNLPAITAGWLTAAGIAASALNGKGDWPVGKTGYSLTQAFPANFASLSIDGSGLVNITQAAADKVWGTASRVLTAGTNIALAKGTGVTGFNDLDAAGVAAATWNAATATYGSAGSYGLLIETNLDAQVSTVGGGSLTEAGIADAVWDEALAGHAVAGSAGAGLSAAGSAGDPWSTLLPGAYGAGTAGKILGTNLDAPVSGATAPTAAAVADAVWDEVLSGHLTAGSTGYALNAAGSAGDPWATALPGAYGAGTAGKIIGDNINATVSSRASQTSVDTVDTVVDSILVDTAVIGVAGAGLTALATQTSVNAIDDLLDTEMPALTAAVASVQSDTNDIQTRLPAALVGGRMDSNLSAISNSTTTLAAFNRAVKGNVIGTVAATSTTTSIKTSSLTPAASVVDQLKGRIIIFADDTTTAALRGQATDITASTASATPTFTVTALTTAPAAGDTFVLV